MYDPAVDRACGRNICPLHYTGRLTFRGTLKPLEATTIQPRACITHPGAYGLGVWNLETQVLETSWAASDEGKGKIRLQYQQGPSLDDESCLFVCSVHSAEAN